MPVLQGGMPIASDQNLTGNDMSTLPLQDENNIEVVAQDIDRIETRKIKQILDLDYH